MIVVVAVARLAALPFSLRCVISVCGSIFDFDSASVVDTDLEVEMLDSVGMGWVLDGRLGVPVVMVVKTDWFMDVRVVWAAV